MTRAALLTAAACLPLLLCLDAAGQGAPPSGDGQAIYRYVNAKGRPVYVNDKARIPPRFRSKARPVDLSAVSLNRDLASEIEGQVKRYEERKKAQQAARKAARGAKRGDSERPVLRLHEPPAPRTGVAGWFGRLWRSYDYLIVIAGALLLLLAFTPYVIRRIDPDRWVRVLMIAIPLLASLGIMSYAMTRTAQLGEALRADTPELSPGQVTRGGDPQDKEFMTDDDGWVGRRDPVKAPADEPAQGTIRGMRQLLQQLENQRKRVEREAR